MPSSCGDVGDFEVVAVDGRMKNLTTTEVREVEAGAVDDVVVVVVADAGCVS